MVSPSIALEKISENPAAALSIRYRALASLRPYANNARTHSPSQIAQLKASLARFGWTNPILTAGDTIIAGHARHQAACEMARDRQPIARHADALSAPTADLSALSAAERRAYIIADNKLAEAAGWDAGLLKIEFAALQSEHFDLSLTGFDLSAIAEMLSAAPADAAGERALTTLEDDQMDVAWRRAISEWSAIIDDAAARSFISTSYTKGALAVLYLRALFFGDDIPRGATLAYTPSRLTTIGDKGAIGAALRAAMLSESRPIRDSIRWVCVEKPSFDKLIGAMSLPIHGHRLPNDFPALLARDLIDEFALTDRAAVLDPCHGWGGRALGFLLSQRARTYHGYDPAPATHAGVTALLADLSALTPARVKRSKLACLPFEDAVLPAARYDLALTSPPYYDVEKYDGAASSWSRYPSFDAWVDGFYAPLIASTARALKPGAAFLLQVGSQRYPLTERALAIAPSHRLRHIETRHTHMINNRAATEPDQGEVVIVLRKTVA